MFKIQKTTTRVKNASLNEEEYCQRKIALRSYPRIAFIELTRNCNLNCSICGRQPGICQDPHRDMPYSLFESVAQTLLPYAEFVDLRGYGESLIYPNIIKVIEYAASFGCQPRIYTNLTVSNRNILDALMAHNVITAVSFDAASARVFEEIRMGAHFTQVLKNLETIVSLRDKYKLTQKVVYLSVVVQQKNIHEIPQIVRLAYDYKISLVKLFPLQTGIKNPENPFNHLAEVKQAIDEAGLVAKKYGVDIELGASLHPALTVQSALCCHCLHPWAFCYISYNGGVGFCDHLMGNDRYLFGNWKDNEFHKIWNNSKFLRKRKQHVRGLSFWGIRAGVCRWCYYFRYSDIEHWIRTPDQERVVSSSKGKLYDIDSKKDPA